MKIRNKILIYFSSTVVILTAISFTVVYLLFSEYREEEFQQRQKEKVQFTVELMTDYIEMSEDLSRIMDELTIHDFYDEKVLVFDGEKDLIFSSVDDLLIEGYNQILNKLSPTNRWIETKEEDYDVIGIYLERNQKSYYAVSKAYDAFGYSKMYFLRNVLIGIFAGISVIVVFISLGLSNKISKPITALAEKLKKFDMSSENITEIQTETSSYELKNLTEKFNELLKRTNEAFSFQKHTIHHISHELKTPIAVLVSELETLKNHANIEEIKTVLDSQINKAKSLGSIINVLLEISKVESGQEIRKQNIRIDELIFDIIQELKIVYPDFNFELNYFPDEIDEQRLNLQVNEALLRQALKNLMTNCVAYSNNSKAAIKLNCSSPEKLNISLSNSGNPVLKDEEKYLFNHFFRGENSRDKTGFGLGLVLTKRIIKLNSGTITYSNPSDDLNVFELQFLLS
ncbi:MAG: HAMP domain-containing histidine kinase [Bacteroidales bacterium]|nr:HAMP domain-containing histidine kinase [Bacteroidales bacterium]